MKDLRPAIIRAHEAGRGMREIARFLDITPMMVSRAINRFEETGSNKDRTGRGRKKTARSKKNIQRAKGMIRRNPTTKANSKRKLAKKLGVGPTQAWEILRKDLKMKPWKYRKRQKLNAQAKQKRCDRLSSHAEKILSKQASSNCLF
uniref:Transposase IS30-like HTH domain-containing protein n=1 Tax=Ditylenchus dipsaci TaxID=166011 RepID=A0A915DF60_9BILA